MAFRPGFVDSWQDKREAERALAEYAAIIRSDPELRGKYGVRLESERLGRELHYSLYVDKL